MQDELLMEWCIPDDHSQQVTTNVLTERLLLQNNEIETVMDLGCGVGDSVDFFRAINQSIRWIGLDIENSHEVNSRNRKDAEFYSFDGVTIPFDENFVDLVYCNQVFEHVRNPSELLKEVQRVLKPGGYFVGSTSQLEPFHSRSVWNYTPFGFRFLADQAGLQLVEIRPSIDALTLIMRRLLGRPKVFSRWWKYESPLNKIIGLAGRIRRRSHREINLAKLMYCGQFCFVVQKCRSNSGPPADYAPQVSRELSMAVPAYS